MYTTVKIAPIEQWCKRAKADAELRQEVRALVGRPVRIDTTSIRVNDWDGEPFKEWLLHPDDAKSLTQITGHSFTCLCEHLLEMD